MLATKIFMIEGLLLLLFGNSCISGFNEVQRVHVFIQGETTNVSLNVYESVSHHSSRHKKNTAYDVIKKLGATKFLRLASFANVDSLLKNPYANITVFVPTNEAMSEVPLNKSSNLTSIDLLIRFHIAIGIIHLSDISENGMLNSLAKYGWETARYRLQIRTNIYKMNASKIFSANGAEIIKPNQSGNGTVVHLVNKALYPLPIECAYYTIFHHPDFRVLKILLGKSITLLRVLCDLGRRLTFFAPTDEAFIKLPAEVLTKLQNDVPLLTKLLVEHIASNIYYTVGIQDGKTVEGVDNNKILLQKMEKNCSVTINNVTGHLSIPDISVVNGVVHGVDTVLYNTSSNPGVDMLV